MMVDLLICTRYTQLFLVQHVDRVLTSMVVELDNFIFVFLF